MLFHLGPLPHFCLTLFYCVYSVLAIEVRKSGVIEITVRLAIKRFHELRGYKHRKTKLNKISVIPRIFIIFHNSPKFHF